MSHTSANIPAPSPDIRPASLVGSLLYGALSLGLVSVLAYSLWAFRLIRGEPLLYTAIAAVYLGVGGIAISRLARPRMPAPRFAALFAAGFLVYALLWCACWFGLRGKYQADLWGALAGLAALTFVFQRIFAQRSHFFRLLLVLFALHSLGYYAGEYLYATVRGSSGRLLWGAAHGLGFGAGLGYLLHRLQGTAPR